MGIKTKFNPMGGMIGDKGKLSDWRYRTAANGQITLLEYLGTYSSTKPVYVPVKKGKTVINDYVSGITSTANDVPFYNNPSLIRVDLQNVPFKNDSMFFAFNNCQNLISVAGMNQNVTDMRSTFEYCHNLNQNIQIPNSVRFMRYTFFGCRNLNQNIQIPNSVTDVSATFEYCSNLNQNIQIPNSVTQMRSTFNGCSNLNQNIKIPNSVIDMTYTFGYCYNLNQNIQIPNSVTSMLYTFQNCVNLQGTITISSANVTNTNYCFQASGLTKNVIFPLRYINNVNTVTRNSLVTAATGGYAVGTAVGNLVNNTAQNAVFYAYDPIAWEGYNTWSGNGTHWELRKWAGIGRAADTTDVVVPQEITSYDTFPTTMNYQVFSGNTVISSVTLPDYIPWATQMGNYKNTSSRYGAFNGCTNLKHIHAKINSQVTVADEVFRNCHNLTVPDVDFSESSLIRCTDLFADCSNLTSYIHPLPNTLTSTWSTFARTNWSQDSVAIPDKVTSMATCFNTCDRVPTNIYILSPSVSNILNTFRGRDNTYRTNLYIYYTYSNEVNTVTYNSFKANNIYKGTSGNAAGTHPLYNSTSNIYVYDLTRKYQDTNVANILSGYTYVQSGSNYELTKYTGGLSGIKVPTVEQVKLYPDSTSTISYGVKTTISNNCFNSSEFLAAVDLQNVPWTSNSMANAFRSLYFLEIVRGINPSVTSMAGTFSNCDHFNQNIQIPNSVTNMAYTFNYCPRLNQNIQIPNSVTNIAYTFFYCGNLQGTINILSNQIINAYRCFYLTSLPKNVYIPFKYSNGVNSATFNSFVSAGYLTSAGISTGQDGVTVQNLNA